MHDPTRHDPLAPELHVEFPHDDCADRLDGIRKELSVSDYEKLQLALGEIFRWVCKTNLDHKEAQSRIGRRFVALAWCVNPKLITGEPSLSRIAEKFGVSKSLMSVHATDATRKFGTRNRFQNHCPLKKP